VVQYSSLMNKVASLISSCSWMSNCIQTRWKRGHKCRL